MANEFVTDLRPSWRWRVFFCYVTSFSLEEFTNISNKLAATNFKIDEANF